MIDWFYDRTRHRLTELGAASLSLGFILLFGLFILWFFGGYGREATTHTREESERARQQALDRLRSQPGEDRPESGR